MKRIVQLTKRTCVQSDCQLSGLTWKRYKFVTLCLECTVQAKQLETTCSTHLINEYFIGINLYLQLMRHFNHIAANEIELVKL